MKNQESAQGALRARVCSNVLASWVCRIALVAVSQLVLLSSASAAFFSTQLWVTYSFQYPFHVVWGPGLMPDANACVVTYNAWNAEIQANPGAFYVTGIEYVGFSNSYPWICSHNSIRPDGSKQPGSYWIRQGGTTCPAGSTLTSAAYCECNAGYVQEGDRCIVPRLESAPSCRVTDGLQKGHPILPATAEKYRAELDWSDGGPAALSFERYHRSKWNAIALAPQAGMGQSWSHSHHVSLSITSDSNLATAVIAFPEGETQTFTKPSGSSAWSASHTADTLVEFGPNSLVYKRASDDATFNFDGGGKLQSRSERNGWATVYAYDAYGRLGSVTNPFGRSLTFVYNGAGQLTGITTPDARSLGYTYDAVGRLASVQYPDGKSRGFVYENASFPQALTGILDESGVRWGTFAYDSIGRAIATELNGGFQRYQVSYGSPGTATVTDPLGTNRTYKYGLNASKIAVTSGTLPSGEGERDAKTRVQDANGLVTSETDFKNVRSDVSWDTARRLPTSLTRAAGTPESQTIATQWHASFGLPVLITEAGRTTAFSYDAQGRLTNKTVTDTSSSPNTTRGWQWTYNSQGLTATETAPNGGVTAFEFGGSGNVTTSTDALGHATLYAYDSANRLISRTEANGFTTAYTWDARDRMLTKTAGADSSSAQTTALTYTPTGLVETLALPTGLVLSYTYDAAHRLTGWSNNRGETGTYTLDAMGNRTAEQIKDSTAAVAWIVARSINNINRVTSRTEGPNQTYSFLYDANGERTRETNGLNQSTSYGLDNLRRVKTITNAVNAIASLSYNALDAVTGASDFKSVATNYGRDAQGNATAESSADTGSRSAQFDALGLPSQIVDALGQATQIQRDAVGRPTQLGFADGKTTILGYDSPQAGKGYLSSITDRSGTTSYTRDVFGRVTTKTQQLASGLTQQVSYGYATSGQIATIVYPSGSVLGYQYDSTGRLVQMTWNGQSLVNNIQWNPMGQPKAWTWAFTTTSPSLSASRSYDTAGRLTATEFSNYVYNAAGRITSLTQNLYMPADSDPTHDTITSADVTWSVSYDSLGRITGFSVPGASPANSATFSYDLNGNRTASTRSVNGQTTNRGYTVISGTNRLNGFGQTAGGTTTNVTYGYNANGDLISDGLRTYTYNAEGRLSDVTTGATDASPTTRYAHNALGQRVFKTEPQYPPVEGDEADPSFWQSLVAFFTQLWNPVASSAEQLGFAYVYDEDGTLLAETGTGGANSTGSTQHIWLPTVNGPTPVATIIDGITYAVHSDHLNTPRRITATDGQVLWQWRYSGFGDEEPTVAAKRFTSTTTNPTTGSTGAAAVTYNLRHPGQYSDKESGLFYNYFRSYDSRTGRYSQADPIGLDGGWNRFGYVNGNPLKYSDPTGLLAVLPTARDAAPAGLSMPRPGNQATPVPGSAPDAVDALFAPKPTASSGSQLCLDDGCAAEVRGCTALCTRARTDPDLPTVFGGSFRTCMRSCLPARCGGF